ncbi:hypothetical protein D3C78_867630 [compost metagenome]
MVHHQAGDKAFFLTVAVGHTIIDRQTAAGAVQEVQTVTQVIQQGQFELAQCLLRRNVFCRQRLQTLQIVEEQYRVIGFLLKHP